MTKEQYLDKNIQTWLSFIISSGEGGHKQPIVAIMDNSGARPSQANNWLLNEDGTEFAGQFRNSSQQTFEFTIQKAGESWERSFKPSSRVADNGVK